MSGAEHDQLKAKVIKIVFSFMLSCSSTLLIIKAVLYFYILDIQHIDTNVCSFLGDNIRDCRIGEMNEYLTA